MPEAAPRVEPEQTPFEMVRPRWQARAACRPDVMPHVWQQFDDCKTPTDLFYPPQNFSEARSDAIAAVCGTCPVREDCYEFGIEHEKYGWWGGVNPTDLDKDRRGRGLGAPWALEVDTRTRKVIGTFIMPGHGTPERYSWHIRDGEKPCEACLSAHTEFYKPEAAKQYAERRATQTPEEKLEKNRLDRIRRNKAKAEGRLRYRG